MEPQLWLSIEYSSARVSERRQASPIFRFPIFVFSLQTIMYQFIRKFHNEMVGVFKHKTKLEKWTTRLARLERP